MSLARPATTGMGGVDHQRDGETVVAAIQAASGGMIAGRHGTIVPRTNASVLLVGEGDADELTGRWFPDILETFAALISKL